MMQRSSHGRWKLLVSYPTGSDGYHWGTLDVAIVNAVGQLDSVESDTTINGDIRRLVFRFGTEGNARKARQRVLNLHKRGIRTQVSR